MFETRTSAPGDPSGAGMMPVSPDSRRPVDGVAAGATGSKLGAAGSVDGWRLASA
jgi:hypothetical protein